MSATPSRVTTAHYTVDNVEENLVLMESAS